MPRALFCFPEAIPLSALSRARGSQAYWVNRVDRLIGRVMDIEGEVLQFGQARTQFLFACVAMTVAH